MVATAAKHHSTPVVVCTGMYKLSPIYPYDTDAFNTVVGPEKVFPFEEGMIIFYDFLRMLRVYPASFKSPRN